MTVWNATDRINERILYVGHAVILFLHHDVCAMLSSQHLSLRLLNIIEYYNRRWPLRNSLASIIRGPFDGWIRVVKVSLGLDLGDQASRLALLLYDKDASHVNLLFLESWTCRQMDS